MNDITPNKHKETWRISDMASHVQDEFVSEITPHGDDGVSPSAERIKALALEKRLAYLSRKEEKPVKKATFSIILVAALVFALSITAFAALGGLDVMKSIFGESVQPIENEIVIPEASASADGRELALEALLTDGYVTHMVVSLTGDKPSDENLFAVESGTDISASYWHPLEEFSTEEKTCYALELVSAQHFDTADITLSLNADVADIDLSFQAKSSLGNAVIDFGPNVTYGGTRLDELQISPMGFLLIANEEDAQGGLPAISIQLTFADGHTADMDVEFAPSDETVGGGGGAVIDAGPDGDILVKAFTGHRNPAGELIIQGQFSRIINPGNITQVTVDGTSHAINEANGPNGV